MTTSSKRPTAEGVRPAVRFVTAGYRRALGVMAGTAFIGGLAEALFLVTVTRTAFAITEGKDNVGIVSNRFLSVNQTLLLAFGLVVLRVAMAGIAAWQGARVSSSVVARVRRRLARAFLRSSWEVQQNQKGGSLQELIGGYGGQAATLMTGVSNGVVGMANLVAMLGLAIAIDPLGAVVMVVSVAVLSSALRPLRRAVRRRASLSQAAGMNLATSTSEIAQLGMELHVFQVQEQAYDRIAHDIDATRDRTRSQGFAQGASSTAYSGLAYVALLAALTVVSVSSVTSLTSLGAVLLVMLRSLGYGQSIQGAYLTVTASAPSIDRLIDQLEIFDVGERHDGGLPVGNIGSLAADHLKFAYADGRIVLNDLSFTIAPHEVVGIVGPSGGGKSTLVELLLGLRDPQSGAVLADGRDIRELNKTEWARLVTFVPQSAHLIAGTIADNIRFMRDGVSDADIERAATLAHLHGDIAEFPEGYERPVGEMGGHLSGGQQQRLCIARALVEQPDVLILDEPTSALDVRSEHLIRTTLLALKDQMTVIVIAHRLSTLDICDRIMVIQSGELRGFDSPSRLEESNDFYREALQLSGMR